ncbi:MAG: hypothetical protein NC340_00810 [Ruminococcus flavefaciens]|nr:hypothetical protein [Ruminococcus flavefaciens]MCM1228652.1 hypothetical protein [Ruminococcus flavefaciens]
MNRIQFLCKCCKQPVRITRTIPEGFADWAYNNIIWTDFDEKVPPPSKNIFMNSDRIPRAGELRTIQVASPFAESVGSEFNAIFSPVSILGNGWGEYPEDIDKCAVVRCHSEKILAIDKYGAYLRVKVQHVTPFAEIPDTYEPVFTDDDLESVAGMCKCDTVECRTDKWEAVYWTGQSDIGENKLICIDRNRLRHLIIIEYYDFHEDIAYIGNIINESEMIHK